MRTVAYAFLIIIYFSSCANNLEEDQNASFVLSLEFKEYWYSGTAEISSYKLQQARYGEIHEGNAVLIFVTEDFSKSKQVKLDDPSTAEDDKESILKLNFNKKFNTGIYPYSMMMSVFSPVDIHTFPRPLKVAMTVQEWCGQVFTQLNFSDEKFLVSQYSYFESEGDKEFKISSNYILEDELWNKIRIDYSSLPNGEVTIIPGVLTNRLIHGDLAPKNATTSFRTFDGDTLAYRIEYEDDFTLEIKFSSQFPYKIYGWTESLKGVTGEILETKAELNKTVNIDYWSKNKKEYSYLRDSLNLK